MIYQSRQQNKVMVNPFIFIYKRTDNVISQFIRYILIGNISNIVDFSCLYVLTEFVNIHYTISVAFAFLIGLVINHIIGILWIFGRSTHNVYVEFLLVLIISIIGLILSEIIIFVLVEYMSLHYMISKFVSAVIVMFWNFYGRRKWIFVK